MMLEQHLDRRSFVYSAVISEEDHKQMRIKWSPMSIATIEFEGHIVVDSTAAAFHCLIALTVLEASSIRPRPKQRYRPSREKLLSCI